MAGNDERDAAIFERVRALGGTSAIVSFSGGGDEGGPERLEVFSGDRDVSPAEPGWELMEQLAAPIYDEWGGFAGEFHVDGRLHIDAAAGSLRLETTRLVEDEEYERQGREEELRYLVREAGGSRAELEYTWDPDRGAELGALRLLQDEREVRNADVALLRQSMQEAVEADHAGSRAQDGVLVVDVEDDDVKRVERPREDIPRRGLLDRLLRRRGA